MSKQKTKQQQQQEEQVPKILKQYKEDGTSLKCNKCGLFFTLDQCDKYTTTTGNMTYPICPNHCSKHPMRGVPRYKKHWKKRVEVSRIE